MQARDSPCMKFCCRSEPASSSSRCVAALLVNLLPVVGLVAWFRPDFVALVVLYWCIQQPREVGFTAAWLLGLMMDVADGSSVRSARARLLGARVRRDRPAPARAACSRCAHQIVHVVPLLLLNDLIVLGVRMFAGARFPGCSYFVGSFVAARMWPVLTVHAQAAAAADARSRPCLNSRSIPASSSGIRGSRSITSGCGSAIASIFVLCMFTLLFARFFYLQVVQHELLPHARRSEPHLDRADRAQSRHHRRPQRRACSRTTIRPTRSRSRRAKSTDLEALIDELATVVEITPRDRRRFSKLLEESKSFDSLPIRTRLSDEEIATFAANRYRFPGRRDQRAAVPPVSAGRDRFARDRPHRPHQPERHSISSKPTASIANYRGTDYIGKDRARGRATRQHLHGTTGVEEVEVDSRRPRRAHAVAHPRRSRATTSCSSSTRGCRKSSIARSAICAARWSRSSRPPAACSRSSPSPDSIPICSSTASIPELERAQRHRPTSRWSTARSPALIRRAPRSSRSWRSRRSLWASARRNRRSPIPAASTSAATSSATTKSAAMAWSTCTSRSCLLRHLLLRARERPRHRQHRAASWRSSASAAAPASTSPANRGACCRRQEWKMRALQAEEWYAGETISVGIGQGYNSYTPLQLAQAIATIANDGVMFRPHIVELRGRHRDRANAR